MDQDRLRVGEENNRRIASSILLAAASSQPSRPSRAVQIQDEDPPSQRVHPPIDESSTSNKDNSLDTAEQLTPEELQSSLDAQRRLIPREMKLVFASTPESPVDVVPELDGTKGDNALFYSIQGSLLSLLGRLKQLQAIGDKDLDRRLEILSSTAESHIQLLETRKHEAWQDCILSDLISRSAPVSKGPVVLDHDMGSRWAAKKLEPFILAGLLMACVLHAIAAVRGSNMRFVLVTLQVMLFGCLTYCNASVHLTPAQHNIVNAIPDDIRTVLSALKIEPDITRYASCPRCRSTYAPDPDNPARPYPRRCTFQETDKPPCNKKLVVRRDHVPTHPGQETRVTYEPRKPYPFQSMSSWLLDLFSRPQIARLIRNARKLATTENIPWKDIWDAPALREFLGPDGRTPFCLPDEGAAHLMFSLFIDWFNPFGNKKAGKSHSIGAIYLVCLNLPPELRYLPENVYLAGIIPGPAEPELHQLNHFLRPLIDELLVLWHRGLYLSHTALGSGLLVRVAVIPLRFTREEHLKHAKRWKDAPTEAEWNRLFKKYGLRWSEILRLPYWDPTKFALVDAMHNLLLGVLRHHCRDVWGINVKDKSADGPKVTLHTPAEQRAWLEKVASYIDRGSRSRLSRVRKGYIVTVAELNGAIPPSSTFAKKDYIESLLHWRQTTTEAHRLPPVLAEATADFHIAGGRGPAGLTTPVAVK
ncbi:hypothetical protein NUW54_g1582 [Trametes sanguinea]|uniref:Uncharacterized protein n=1 Tax=Trametes sanguinea TaxID=158606 RepID=A0ACC1Q9R0_9APHY|nr:hypothetical protein NUW54_g1582 [Trametes sanguinea]